MTKNQRAKQARHNAKKDAGRRRLTAAEMEQRFSELRKQEAAANERLKSGYDELEDTWYDWVTVHNQYVVPRLCAGFYYAALQAAKKRLIKSQVELFMDELSSEMQKIVTAAGESECEGVDQNRVNEEFDRVRALLDAEGYAVPEWAQLEDFDKVKEIARGEKK